MIYISYTQLDHDLSPFRYQQYLSLLSPELQEKNMRYTQWKDRMANLFGKLLLADALERSGYVSDCMKAINYNSYGRPYIDDGIDFNLSHSGNYVICAIGRKLRLGVDIEEIKPVHFDEFSEVMTATQWQEIKQSGNPLRTFYSYWAIKESVIKADTRGMSISLDKIIIGTDQATCENSTWFLTNININEQYCSWLATDQNDAKIEIEYKRWD